MIHVVKGFSVVSEAEVDVFLELLLFVLLKLMSIKSVMPSNHVILVSPFSSCLQFFPASEFFSKELVLCIGYFLNDPADVGNLISGSSAFSKSSLNIWKFTVHIPLKPGLENFEHYFAACEMSAVV